MRLKTIIEELRSIADDARREEQIGARVSRMQGDLSKAISQTRADDPRMQVFESASNLIERLDKTGHHSTVDAGITTLERRVLKTLEQMNRE